MNHWIFGVTEHEENGETFAPEEVFRQRMADGFWGLGERTPNRSSLRKGDEVVWYVGRPVKSFSGRAVLASDSFETTEEQRNRVSHGKNFYRAEYGVFLEQIQIWDKPLPVDIVLAHLKFIENKRNWGAYFQGGVRQISEEDFRTATRGPLSVDLPIRLSEDNLESDSEFALETHLEEFIDKNWESINFGLKLARYKAEDQDGRQFPAGPWSIDFLCTESDTGDFVVVELKRGKTSDTAVGQVLRYIGWVRKNMAKEGQRVKGIIIAKEVDEALGYAVRDLADVSVSTYKVDFSLAPFKK
jgi:predicted RNA-binding protein